jgi:hypothetical protein
VTCDTKPLVKFLQNCAIFLFFGNPLLTENGQNFQSCQFGLLATIFGTLSILLAFFDSRFAILTEKGYNLTIAKFETKLGCSHFAVLPFESQIGRVPNCFLFDEPIWAGIAILLFTF